MNHVKDCNIGVFDKMLILGRSILAMAVLIFCLQFAQTKAFGQAGTPITATVTVVNTPTIGNPTATLALTPTPSISAPPASDQLEIPSWLPVSTVISGLLLLIAGIFASRLTERRKQQLAIEQEIARESRQEQREDKKAAAAAETQRQQMEKTTQELVQRSENYRRQLAEALNSLALLDWPRTIQLDEIFIEPLIKEVRLNYQSDEDRLREQTDSAEELLRRRQARLSQWKRDSLSPEQALSRWRRIVVLGDPGAGKTTILHRLAIKAANRELKGLPDFPLFVTLKLFVESPTSDIIDYISSELDQTYGFPGAKEWLYERMEEGAVMLLLDGLDEVAVGNNTRDTEQLFQKAWQEIERLRKRYPRISIILTCRRHGWRQSAAGFQVLETLDFTWEQIAAFIRHWFREDPQRAEALREELQANLRLQTLAANPLMLSLISMVFEQGLKLPEHRTQLYGQCVSVLLKQWDSKRHIQRRSAYLLEEKKELLARIAWHFQLQKTYYFGYDELLNVIGEALPALGLAVEENVQILDEIADQYGLLKQQAIGWYGFFHPTFQEYFAALYVDANRQTTLPVVVDLRQDAWWEEVILLLGGHMDDASSLILGILGRSMVVPEDASIDKIVPLKEQLARSDDLFCRDLLRAAEILIGSPGVKVNDLRERLLNEVRELLLSSPFELDRDRAARVIAEIQDKKTLDDVIAVIRDQKAEKQHRAVIVQALGHTNSKIVARRLLEVLQQGGIGSDIEDPLIEALGNLKAVEAVPVLLRLFQRDSGEDYRPRHQLIDALGKINDPAAVEALKQAIRESDESGGEGVWQEGIFAVQALEDPSVAPFLLELVSDGKGYCDDVEMALGRLADETLIPSIIELLRDKANTTVDRWGLATSLNSKLASGRSQFLELLNGDELDDTTKVALAVSLGRWGEPAALPFLTRGITERIVPPGIRLPRRGDYYYWRRITSSLNALGDTTLVPVLNELLDEARMSSDFYYQVEFDGIVEALMNFESETSLRHLIDIASNPRSSEDVRVSFYGVEKMANKTTVPLLRHALRTLGGSSASYLLKALSLIADDISTQGLLIDIIAAAPDQLMNTGQFQLAHEFYEALYQISARTLKRVPSELRPRIISLAS